MRVCASPCNLPPFTCACTVSLSAYLPLARRRTAHTPGVSDAASTAAPAPSPNSTQVERSFQSKMWEYTSAPTISTRAARPATIIASPSASA